MRRMLFDASGSAAMNERDPRRTSLWLMPNAGSAIERRAKQVGRCASRVE